MRHREAFATLWVLVTALAASTQLLAQDAPDDQTLSAKLIALERQSWVAWQSHDAKFFADFLSDDHTELGAQGPADKAAVVRVVGSPVCKVDHYEVDDFHFTRLAPDAAVLVYRAEQQTTCAGKPVPSPVWATSIYALRKGEWKNIVYEHLPISPPPSAPEKPK